MNAHGAVSSRSKSFPIHQGNFTLYPDRIEIQLTGLAGLFSSGLYRMGFKRNNPTYFFLTLVLILGALASWYLQNIFLFAFLIGAALVNLNLWRENRNQSISPLIYRKDIQSVVFKDAIPGQSRAGIMILFTEGDKKRKRFVRFPSMRMQGETVAQSARQILEKELVEVFKIAP